MKHEEATITSKNSKKAPRRSDEERELKRQQKDREQQAQAESAEQESQKVLTALEEIKSSDRKSAEHAYNAGKGLYALQQNKRYRVLHPNDQPVKTFKEFVGVLFFITEQYAYMLINAFRVQEILFGAKVSSSHIPEKLLRKLTFLLRAEDGSKTVVRIWKEATGSAPDTIPTDKELNDAVAAYKQTRKPTVTRNDSDILNDPATPDDDIISLLRRLSSGKAHLSEDDISTLKDRLGAICDNATKDNN